MTTSEAKQRLIEFERHFDYDASYAHEMLTLIPETQGALEALQVLGSIRQGVSTEAWFAARLLASAREDCGPCTQLVTTMALREGVDPELLAAVLAGRWDALPDDVALVVRYVDAVLSRHPDADELRAPVEERFGRSGVISLALGVVASRSYPTLKYLMGLGHQCSRVQVGDQLVAVETGRGRL